MSSGVITAVGRTSEVQIPADARVIDCTGKTIVAGFWNSHVHFTEAVWKNAANGPAAPLTAHMQEMLTQWGVTTVWDLGANPDDTVPLRRRINSGEVLGPDDLPGRQHFSQGWSSRLSAAGNAAADGRDAGASRAVGAGATCKWALDGIKLFTGVLQG